MRRFVDFDRSEREIPFGKMTEFGDVTVTDRVDAGERRRRPGKIDDSQATVDQIELIAGRFGNKRSRTGCVKRKRIRPERLWVALYLARKMQGYPPRVLAQVYGVVPSFVYNAIPKGRRLVESMARSGGFDDLIQSSQSD